MMSGAPAATAITGDAPHTRASVAIPDAMVTIPVAPTANALALLDGVLPSRMARDMAMLAIRTAAIPRTRTVPKTASMVV